MTMRFAMFCHSLVSDWNHGNAHFLRGVVRELQRRGHQVRVLEPEGGWSRSNLVREQGPAAVAAFRRVYPDLSSATYDPELIDLDQVLDAADAVLVHEWTDPALVHRIGQHRIRGGRYRLFFHDTHHRAVTDPSSIAANDFSGFDGVLCFGEVLRQIYLREGWARRAWTWHEAADISVFRPCPGIARDGDLVWIGNWGDGERSAEIREFLLDPIRELGLSALIHGVRYPKEAVAELSRAGARYGGWLPNHSVPEVFARFRATAHIPRGPYARALPGIPTIRVFEALACGIPLITAPWEDAEGMFRPGRDFLCVRTGRQMVDALRLLLSDPDAAAELASSGLETVRSRHTCAHRVDQLLGILAEMGRGALAETPIGAA